MRSDGNEMTESLIETRYEVDEMGWKRAENQLETDEEWRRREGVWLRIVERRLTNERAEMRLRRRGNIRLRSGR